LVELRARGVGIEQGLHLGAKRNAVVLLPGALERLDDGEPLSIEKFVGIALGFPGGMD
jgi:hypothetical protein